MPTNLARKVLHKNISSLLDSELPVTCGFMPAGLDG